MLMYTTVKYTVEQSLYIMRKIFNTLMMRLTHQKQVAYSLKNWLLFHVCKKYAFCQQFSCKTTTENEICWAAYYLNSLFTFNVKTLTLTIFKETKLSVGYKRFIWSSMSLCSSSAVQWSAVLYTVQDECMWLWWRVMHIICYTNHSTEDEWNNLPHSFGKMYINWSERKKTNVQRNSLLKL